MNRNSRESLIGARNFPASLSQHRRGHSLTLNGGPAGRSSGGAPDENHLDLFSKNRRSLSVTSSDESSDVSVKLGRLSVGSSAKVSRNGIDDLLSSADGGKHDYDWLLTPPGTPTMYPPTEGTEPQRVVGPPRGTPLARSSSTTKASRLSVSHTETNTPSRPARSSSVTRSSTSSSLYNNNYSSNRSSNMLNTSSASVSSYIRPSSPVSRSSSSARPSTPTGRPSLSRPATPSRARPAPPSSSGDRSRPGQISRPSTPSSRPQLPANLSTPSARSNSRPSTPTRRSPAPSISPAASPSISATRGLSSGRSSAPSSRPSSPSPRVRPLPAPVVPSDFPLDTPPNLRTTLPDRPVSAGRSRPGAPSTPKGNSESVPTVSVSRRHSSPIVARGRSVSASDASGRARSYGNGHAAEPEPRRSVHSPDLSMRKPVKASTNSAESLGFGRNISKKSLDMAIRHMDIRNGGNIRPISGSTLFPQSIRPSTPKAHSARSLNGQSPNIANGGLQTSYNGLVSENGNHRHMASENGREVDLGRRLAKLSDVDIYESSRYDTILLKEDLKNTNWLHSIDDKSDGPIFDHGFESLPEPFGLL